MDSYKIKSYLTVLIISVLFLVIGNRLAIQETAALPQDDEFAITFVNARVTEMIERVDNVISPGFIMSSVIFEAQITRGDKRGLYITAEHTFDIHSLLYEMEVAVGDRVILFYDDVFGGYYLAGHQRIQYIVVLGIVFFVLVLLFARVKGFNSILSLIFICLAIFLVFIPAILGGANIYFMTIVICIYAIVSTLFMVVGVNKKAVASLLGCMGGVLLAGLMMLSVDRIIGLTGHLDGETSMLLFLDNPVDLRALVFASVVIGAVGAIMDVAMSISTSLWELSATGVVDFRRIVKAGMNIGKDILGTMLNTLILAYIGSSMSLILLIVVHSTSFDMLFSMEMIIVEFLRALIGSFGMLLTIPLTAVICGWLFVEKEGTDTEYTNWQ